MRKPIRILCAVLAITMLLSVPALAVDPPGDMIPVTELAPTNPSKTFSDVKTDAWYYANLNTLVRAGGIDGLPNGSFNPDGGLKLCEFIKILVSIMYPGQTSPWDEHHIDGQYVTWYSPFVGAAAYVGLLDNVTYNYAALEAPVNRYTMAQIMVNAADVMGDPLWDDQDVSYIIYDYNSIPAMYKTYVRKAYYEGILTGQDSKGSFNGNSGLTRAEACTAIVRLFDYEKRVGFFYFYDDFDGNTIAVKVPEAWGNICDSYYEIDDDGDYWMDFYSIASDDGVYDGWVFSIIFSRTDWPDLEYLGYDAGMYYFLYMAEGQQYDPANTVGAAEYNTMLKDLDNGAFSVIVKSK